MFVHSTVQVLSAPNNPGKKHKASFIFPSLEPLLFSKDFDSCPYFSQQLTDNLRKYHEICDFYVRPLAESLNNWKESCIHQ